VDLSFLIANLLAVGAKAVWFKKDTRARDIVLPILVFGINFLSQLAQALQGDGVTGAVLGDTVNMTALSLATHQGALWGKSLAGGK
jgi:hypothetical protein